MVEWLLPFVRGPATEDELQTTTFSTQVCREW